MTGKSVRCQACGEANDAEANLCARCGEPLSASAADESPLTAGIFLKWPAWLRWILVAPVLTIAATIAVRACAIEGVRTFPSDFAYPLFVSIAIVGSTFITYIVAPSYRKYACFTTALTQLLYFIQEATYRVFSGIEPPSHDVRNFLGIFIAVPVVSTIIAMVYLGRRQDTANAPVFSKVYEALSPAARWALFIPNALALSALHGLSCLAVSHLLPRLYSIIASDIDTNGVGAAIFVGACAAIAPFGKRTVAWSAAGVVAALAVTEISIAIWVLSKVGFINVNLIDNAYHSYFPAFTVFTAVARFAGAIVAALAVVEATAVPRDLPQE